MSQLPQQVITPIVIDPNNVSELYSCGPINLNIMGPCGTLTFTQLRPDLAQTIAGKQATKHYAVVTSRVTTPVQNLIDLRDLLSQMIQTTQSMAPGSPLTQ